MTVSRIEFFAEELSMEAALRNLVPKILPALPEFDVHTFQGKPDLIRKLPERFKGYSSWLPSDWRIVVVVDEDRSNCIALKQKIVKCAREAGLTPKPTSHHAFQVLTRIAVEELEAWFLGDVHALATTYARVPETLGGQAAFRDPDAVVGGTWEALERVLQRAGHFEGGIPKTQVAREVSANMNPAVNRSRSFQVFREGLLSL